MRKSRVFRYKVLTLLPLRGVKAPPTSTGTHGMAHLHLPAKHSDDDLAMAGALAQVLRSEELYVVWSTESGAGEPVVPARLHLAPREAPQRRTLRARLREFFRPTS